MEEKLFPALGMIFLGSQGYVEAHTFSRATDTHPHPHPHPHPLMAKSKCVNFTCVDNNVLLLFSKQAEIFCISFYNIANKPTNRMISKKER